MEAFFKTHKYLVEHLYSPVRRGLMDEIDWNDRLIGIKGSRGVGKTTFLLDYAREHFGADNKECLYINLNHFYFTERTLVDFASEFRAKGGKVLLIDQVFKYSGWSKELRYCYDNFTDLKIIFSGSSVMRLKDENPDLSGKVVSYNLRGFSFREFFNLMSGNSFPAYTFGEILVGHQEIAKGICSVGKPMAYFQDYLHIHFHRPDGIHQIGVIHIHFRGFLGEGLSHRIKYVHQTGIGQIFDIVHHGGPRSLYVFAQLTHIGRTRSACRQQVKQLTQFRQIALFDLFYV